VAEAPVLFGDVESWAEHYVQSTDLAVKLAPPPVPRVFAPAFAPQRLERPGRPEALRLAGRKERIPKLEALKEPHHRARALHAFFHHELQAAELMCWAVLAFPDTEVEFRKGLIGICLDEIRHMNLYREHIERLGSRIGAFGVRDWFWKRVPRCADAIAFVSVMGMGFEGANLEHASIFADRFRAAGDEVGALVQERIAREEVAHVAFATRWFQRWTGGCDFDVWVSHLPPPLSPMVLRGAPLSRVARGRAGMPEAFLSALESYVPEPKGRSLGEASRTDEDPG
jgi:uncharacterized ferritin-like protein (DUF455 family)